MKKVLKNCTIKRKWNFKTKGELIYIQSDSTKKVLGTPNGIKVIEEEFQEGKSEQLWKIGEAMALHHTLQKAVCDKPYMWPTNAEGYFTLENSKLPQVVMLNTEGHEDLKNSKVPMIMTATSSIRLEIKGNITLRWIPSLIDIFLGQLIKLIQVQITSEFHQS